MMRMRAQALVPNMFLHNISELLENSTGGEECSNLAELMELSLINQSTKVSGIILAQDDFTPELAINLGILMDQRVIAA